MLQIIVTLVDGDKYNVAQLEAGQPTASYEGITEEDVVDFIKGPQATVPLAPFDKTPEFDQVVFNGLAEAVAGIFKDHPLTKGGWPDDGLVLKYLDQLRKNIAESIEVV